MTAFRYDIPPTRNQGSCTIIGTASMMETARQNALWQYNDMRRHDGLPPLSALPPRTKSTAIPQED